MHVTEYMEVYSLYELNQYIKQVIALNFVDTIWISCEISSINTSRGHCYLELVEKDELTDQVKAKISAVMWYRDYSFITKKLGKIADQVLQDGMLVKLKVEVDFHERYGIKLLVKDIDPSFTYGQLAIQREKIIERLNKEGRMDLNNGLPFPTVVQKCAIISSDTAAGFQDFMQQLQNNQYGFAFSCELFPAAMQGQRTEMEVISQLKTISALESYDVIIITRGGGSKLDLSAFDSYEIAKQISETPIPVITGIGHDIDQSIADMVSAISLKTPTAVANFLIDHNASFENELYDIAMNLKLTIQNRFKQIDSFLSNYNSTIKNGLLNHTNRKRENLDRLKHDMYSISKNKINLARQQITSWEEMNQYFKPEKLLKKGYSITKINGKLIDKSSDLKKGDKITTEFKDGNINSIVS